MSLILQADALYRASTAIGAERYRVPDQPSEAFSKALTRLGRDLGGEAAESPWAPIVAAARAARWRAATEPVSFASKFSGAAEPIAELLGLAPNLADMIEAGRKAMLDEVIRCAEAYLASGNTQYSDAVRECLGDGEVGRTCVVAVGGRAAASIQGWFSEVGENYPVLAPRTFMASKDVWDLAIVACAGAWLPRQMLTTPRADYLTLVHPGWIRDSHEFSGVFGEYASSGIRTTVREPRLQVPAPGTVPEVDAVAEIPPQPNWHAVTAALPQAEPGEDLVKSRLALLSGGFATFLPDEGDRIRGIDPAAPAGERVLNLKIASIVPGSVLLLREVGSEAGLVRDLAKGELGSRSAEVDLLQQEWKTRLRVRLAEVGRAAAERFLLDHGAKTVNLSYWASDECLRPLRDSDFEILLHYLDLQDGAMYIGAGNELRRAHSKVGHALTRALEHEIEQVDLAHLEVRGFQQLRPKGAMDGATITAYRVVSISDRVFDAVRHTTRRPFEAGGTRWLE